MKASTLTEYAAFVGIDWADRKHDVCLQAGGLRHARVQRAAPSSRAHGTVGAGAATTLRRSPHRRVPGTEQRAAGIRAAAV